MRKRKSEESNWISVADIMTGLMVVFLFISVHHLLIYRGKSEIVQEKVYNSLEEEFKEEEVKGELTVDSNATITFNSSENGDALFGVGKKELTEAFKAKLDRFLPRYLSIITDSAYFNHIREIRIEGHSDTKRWENVKDQYEKNLTLSSQRAQQVLHYIRKDSSFQRLDQEKRDRLKFLFTAVGFSYSRALDKEGDLAVFTEDSTFSFERLSASGEEGSGYVDGDRSRRVDFSITTSNKNLIKEVGELQSE